MRTKFTAGRVDSFQCTPGKSSEFMWDTEQPGLGLKVSAGGSKQYILQSRLATGSPIRLTIGKPAAWSLDDARAEARRLQNLIDQGNDPRQKKAEQAARDESAREQAKTDAMRNSITVQSVWDEYLSHHQDYWGERHYRDHINLSQAGGQPKKRGSGLTVQGVLYPLLQMRMIDINADGLTEWQKQEAQTRANNARQGFEMFRAFWRWCDQHKDYAALVNVQTVENQDLRKKVPARKAKKFDVLQRAQLQDWFESVRNLSNPVIAAYLQGLLLTGARREELAELKWTDIDFKLGAMWVKDKVDAEGRMIPLTPYLSNLITALPRRNQWVFSSPTAEDGKLAEPRIAHNRALDKAGLEHVTLHGLRRTFASLAEWVEMPVGVVAQIMGHAPNATAEKHYKSRPLELLAIWHGKYEAWILEQAAIEFAQSEQSQGLRVVK
jgi:integrase